MLVVKKDDKYKKEIEAFKKAGGNMTYVGATVGANISGRKLYKMREEGVIEKPERGLYRLSDLSPQSNPDLVTVALKAPKGVICLISALSFYGITTQIPHDVHIALKQGSEKPRIKNPPIRVWWMVEKHFSAGIEIHKIDGCDVRIYDIEKTLVDCFRYRNKIGLDVALEALKQYSENKKTRVDKIIHYAKICRQFKNMRPYLEATI